MGLSTRIQLRICVPVLALLLVAGVLYHNTTRQEQLGKAQLQLDSTADTVAELLQSRNELVLQLLQTVISDPHAAAWMVKQGNGDAAGTARERMELRESCENLLKRFTAFVTIEVHDAEGRPLLAVGQREPPDPQRDVSQETWFANARSDGWFMSWERAGIPIARCTRVAPPAVGLPALCVSGLVDYEQLSSLGVMVAVHGLGPVSLAVECRKGQTQCLLGSPPTGEPTLTASAPLPAFGGRVVLALPRTAALAGLFGFERDALIVFALLIVAMTWMLWRGLQSTVLSPLMDVLGVVAAFEQGAPLPPPSGRETGELAQLDASLRSALLDNRSSQRRMQELNEQLELRVSERTSQLSLYTEELRAARDAAQAASRLKSQFVANMSHEVRTPLNGILGMISLLLDSRLDADQRDCAETAQQAGNNLLGIINQILDFSKLEAGRLELESHDFDLGDVIEDAAELLAPSAQHKGLQLAVRLERGCPLRVRGDAGRARQIVINLIGNAIKFTDAGEVVVATQLERLGEAGAVIRVSVSDTGIGVSPEAIERLFAPFSQADSSTTRRFGGTGLGLAICRQLAELMGGTVGVDSQPGRGSTFWCSLSLALQPNGAPHDGAALAGQQVIVAGRHATSRQAVAETLATQQAQVQCSATGAEALAAARDAFAGGHPVDCVILDEDLDPEDWLATARALRNDPALVRTRIVLLASLLGGSAAGREGWFDAQAVKPPRRRALVASLLGAPGSARTPAPRVAEPHAAPLAASTPAAADARPRVLVAEDHPVNQKVAQRLLEKLGVAVDVVGNGELAVAAWSRQDYALVLMDCQMPVMDGYEACARIRDAESGPGRTPIIAMTAHALQGDRERALGAGMDDYLTKPVNAAALAAALDRWIGLPTAPAPEPS